MEQSTSQSSAVSTAGERPFAEVEAALEKSGRVEDLLKLYESRTRDVPPQEAGTLLCRAADVARDRLKSFTRAEEYLRRALLFVPSSPEPLRGLKRLFEQKQDLASLAETLERLAALSSGTEAAEELNRAADIYEGKLFRRDRAILCLQRASQVAPAERGHHRRLRALSLSEYRFGAAFDALERERVALGDEGLVEEYLGLAERLKDDPTEHPLAQRILAVASALAPADARPVQLQTELERFPETWRERVRTLGVLGREERDRKSAARISLLVGKLHAWYDADGAAKVKEALDRCLLLWPGMPEALQFMERLAERDGSWPATVEAIEKMAAESKDKRAAVELWVRAGALRLAKLPDREGALRDFTLAHEADPSRSDSTSLAAELLLEDGKVSEAVDLLDRHQAHVKDRTAKVPLLLRLAELCRTGLRDSEAARAHLELALQIEPGQVLAAFELARLLADAEDLPAAAPLLDAALLAPRPLYERVALCEAMALLYEEGGDLQSAVDVLGRALVLDPERSTLRDSLRDLAQRAGAEPQLAAALRRAAHAAKPPVATSLWRELALLLQGPLRSPVEAQAAWREVLGHEPEDPQAAEAVARLFEAVREAEDPRQKQLGQLQALEDAGAEATEVIPALRELLRLTPDDRAAAVKLQGLLATTGGFEEAATLAASLARTAETHVERGEWQARLGALYAERLSRPEDAAALFLRLLGEGFSTAAVLSGLERLAAGGTHATDIGEALAAHYGRSGDHQRQVAALLVQLGAAQELEQKKRLLSTLSDTHERFLADSRAAFDARLRGVAADPVDERFRAEAVRLARDLSATVELARFFRELAAKQSDEVARGLLAEAAELAEEGQATDEALAALEEAARRLPDDAQLAGHRVRLLVRSGRVSEAEQVLHERVQRAPESERVELLLQKVELCAELDRPMAAAEALQEAIGVGADEARHLPRLYELLEKAGQSSALVRALERGIALADKDGDADRAARLSVRRAQLLEGDLGSRAEAVKSYADVLKQRPTDPDALAALEGLLEQEDCREEAARALVPAYEVIKDHRKLVIALEAIASSAKDQVSRVQALRQAANAHRFHLRQPELAFAALARAVRMTPADAALRIAARQAAEDADQLESFAEVLQEVLEGEVGNLAPSLHRELAELYEKKLDDRPAAVRELHAVLEREPRSIDALRSLQRLHRAGESWAELAAVLERLATGVLEPSEQAALMREAALLQENRLENPGRAAELWRQLAERDPSSREAAGHLERLYAELDQPGNLAFALEVRRAQEGQSPQGRELAFRLATLRQQRLGDAHGALQLYQTILAEEPAHTGTRDALEAWVKAGGAESAAALDVLDPVLQLAGDHQRRVSLREARLEGAPREEQVRLFAQLRAIQERDLDRADMAFLAALRAFSKGLEREALVGELERLARAAGSFDELAEVYEEAAGETPPGDAARQQWLRRAAELQEQVGQGDEAVRLWQLLLEEAPQDREALDALSRLFERNKNARELSEVYARQAQLAADPAERRALLMKAAEAYEEAGAETEAIDALRSALAIDRTADALGSLDRLYARTHEVDAQADVLEQLAQLATDADVGRGHLLRRAQLLEREGRADRALQAWAALLADDGHDAQAVGGLERLLTEEAQRAEAARLLEPVYREAHDHKKLVEVLDLRLQQAAPDERLGRLDEIATLREALGQKAQAFTARLRAFNGFYENEETHDELERVAADTGSFEEVAAAYEDALERGASAQVAENLWRRLAYLYAERLNRLDDAARALEEVSRRAPADLAVLESLGHVHQRAHAFRELAQVMQRRVAAEPSEDRKVQLLFELVQLAEETLSDKALAIQAGQGVLALRPEDGAAIKLLARLYSETERHEDLAQLLEREIELAGARDAREEQCELMVRLGRLRLNRLDEGRSALALYQQVLERRPGHPGAVGALEELARSEHPLRGAAASALEPVFTSGGEHLKLVQMLESQVSAEPSPVNRASLLRRIAEAYSGVMENPEMGFVAATRALREQPDDPANLKLCLGLVGPASAEEELISELEAAIERAVDEGGRLELLRALARLQGQEGEPEAAGATWRKVLELKGSDDEALSALATLLREQGKTAELSEILRRQAAMSEDPEVRAAVLVQLAALQEETLSDPAGALASLRRALEARPDAAGALARLDSLCTRLERWPELADVLVRRLAQASGADAVELHFRLGQVRESRLADRTGALESYGQALAGDPNHGGALARLEAILAREPQNLLAVELHLGALRRGGDEQRLSRGLESRAGVSQDPTERKTLLAELAALRETQGEPELAFLAYWRAYKEDPNDRDVRGKVVASAEAAESHDELVGALEEALPRINDPAEAAEVCLELGRLLETHLEEPDRAVNFLEKARTLSPEAGARALPALDRLYTRLDAPQELAQILEAQAEQAKAPADRLGLLFRLGQLAESRLSAPALAVSAYERILELEPRHLPSLRLLEPLYEAAGDDKKLAGILEVQQELATGPERERVMVKRARVAAEGLEDAEGSIALYRELLEKNPRNEQAWLALEALLERTAQFEALRELVAQRLATAVDPREVVRLNERMGRVLATMLDRPEEALPFFRAALERDPRNRPALESLRGLYEKLERREDLVTTLRRLIPLQESPAEVKGLRLRLAEVLAEMSRREESLDAARRAMEIEPHAVAELERLGALFTTLRAHNDAVRALELTAEVHRAEEEHEKAVETWFSIAALWKGQGKPEMAASALERVLEVDPAHRAAFEETCRLYQEANDWRSYATLADRYVSQLVTDEEKLALLRELARVQEGRLHQKDVAFLTYCRALQLQPADDSVREDVERLAEETGSYDELAAVYEEVAESVPRGPLAERMYSVLARVQDEHLDDPAAAEAALRNILEFDPTNPAALDALARIFQRRGRSKEYVVALEQKIEAAGSLEERKAILREIARVWEEQLDDAAEAATSLIRALELEPELQTLGELAELYRRQKAWPSLAQTLLRARDLASTPEEQAALQLQVGIVYERELGDDEAAVEAYGTVLEFVPTHPEALDALERLYTKLDRPAELLSVYERQLEIAPDEREKVSVLFKSAGIWEDRYQNLQNADTCIQMALSLDPQNLQVIRTLERLRRSQERWDELIEVLGHHVQVATTPGEQSTLYVEMGEIYSQQLRALDRAVSAYQYALQVDPASRPALHALGVLYERTGNWPFALEMLQREAEACGQGAEAVEILHRTGHIHEEMMQDLGAAKAAYQAALAIDPGYLPSIRALKGVQAQEQDWSGFEATALQEARSSDAPEAKAEALLQIARNHAETREDPDGAVPYWEEALHHVPELLEAARPLADIYTARQEWEAAERMLDIVVRQLAKRAMAQHEEGLARDLCLQLYRLGYVSEKLGKHDKALDSFEKAYQFDATHLPTLEGYGHLLVNAGRWEDALKVYQSILIHHREELTDMEVVELYWQLADAHVRLGQADRAEAQYQKALDLDPGHEPSLRGRIALYEQAGRWAEVAQDRQRLVDLVDGEDRFRAGFELGRVAREKLNDPYLAIDAYQSALRSVPDALEALDALYMLYRETGQAQKASEILERMLAVPALAKDPQRAKRVWYALGEVSRDELRDPDRAVHAFNSALDVDFRFLEAFSALEALLSGRGAWKILEENYARMLQRLPKTDDTHAARLTLWRALGDLYHQVLKQPENAFMAYKVVAQGLPGDGAVQETYAALAQALPGNEEEALQAWRRTVPLTQQPARAVNAVMVLSAGRKDYDGAWLAAQVASGLLGDTSEGTREILGKLGPWAKKREAPQAALAERAWKEQLLHPSARGPLAELMTLLYTQAGQLWSVPFTQYGLNPKKHRIDPATSQEYQLHHYRTVSRLFGMDAVDLYSPFLVATRERLARRSNDPAPEPMVGAELLHTQPACLKVGGRFFGETGQKEVFYLLGRNLALLRPELALTQRVSVERLEAIVQAAMTLVVPNYRVTMDLRSIEQERQGLLKVLNEPAKAHLARIARAWLPVAGATSIRGYVEGAELSATRAGYFAAGEAEPVRKLVQAETGTVFRVTPGAKLRELATFGISDDLRALRAAVGTAVVIQVKK